MSTIKDGGTAFPMQEPQSIHAYAFAKAERVADPAERERVYIQARAEAVGGMSLRDYFAGEALKGILSSQQHSADFTHTYRAELAYGQADAMLAAREKGGA